MTFFSVTSWKFVEFMDHRVLLANMLLCFHHAQIEKCNHMVWLLAHQQFDRVRLERIVLDIVCVLGWVRGHRLAHPRAARPCRKKRHRAP